MCFVHLHYLINSEIVSFEKNLELSETLNLCNCVITHTRMKFDKSYFAGWFKKGSYENVTPTS